MKERLYSYIVCIDTLELSKRFWEKEIKNIQIKPDLKENEIIRIVCSASPLFQIKPVCELLGFDYIIATDMNPENGKITGDNCKGKYKLNYINDADIACTIRDVYTDNIKSDCYILDLAKRNKYIVKKGNIIKL